MHDGCEVCRALNTALIQVHDLLQQMYRENLNIAPMSEKMARELQGQLQKTFFGHTSDTLFTYREMGR
jgi:hypothetical protein